MRTHYESDWTAWLGAAAEELTAEQRDHAASRSAARSGSVPIRSRAASASASKRSAIVQYLLEETTIDQAGEERLRTATSATRASLAAQQIARLAVLDGMPEAEAARRAWLDRMTVRKVLGKR